MKKLEKERRGILEKMTLQKQLVFVMVIALLIAAFSFLVLIPRILKPFYEQNIYDYLQQPASFVDIETNRLSNDIAYIIRTKNGAIFVSNTVNELFSDNIDANELLAKVTQTYGKFKYNNNTYYYYKSNRDGRDNIVFTNDSLIKTQETSLIGIILPTMVSTTLIIMMLIFAWSNNVVYKIKKLKYKTENIASDKYKDGEHFSIDDELNMLSKSIDETRKELKEKEEYKNYMFQNLSHELKTPIAVIDSYIEGISDGVVEQDDGLKVIEEQANKLKEQVNTMLYFNKIDYMKEQSEYIKQKVDILNIVSSSVEKHKLQRQDVEFVVISKQNETIFLGTEEMWQTVIDNMLGNFIRYAKSKVTITIKKNKLELYNDGENISQDVLENIFSPYIKGKNGQTGLGLSIAKRITDTFGYNISVLNMDNGVLFVIDKKKESPKEIKEI